ncbi:hypothetical protein GCM10012275_55750 [Longimycelium tulufanense]|uniref:Uncharacterized protein n=1 Tax=Longimycelium tulufanense TaxID=907463 RepID=A0A8J3CJP8_9PSEU|nr:hypothetical protein [Longimycelium tulufanense]GGM77959.1 hypothetical protein GCM10012275_55750 [Longimycelium tulufanense]
MLISADDKRRLLELTMVADQLVDFIARGDFGLSPEARELLVDVYADMALTAAKARAVIAEAETVEERIAHLDWEPEQWTRPGSRRGPDEPGTDESATV